MHTFCSRQKEASLIRNLLASLVHAYDASNDAFAQQLVLHPRVAWLQAQAEANGFEPLGVVGERIRFTGRSIYSEVWANPELSTYLSLVPPQGPHMSEVGYFFNTSFAGGTELLRFNKRAIVTRGRETLEVSAGTETFGPDLVAHALRVAELAAVDRRALPAFSVEDRVAGVERFYRTHLAGDLLLTLTLPALLFLAMATILPCLAAFAGAARGAYAILGLALLLPLLGYLAQRWGPR